MAKTAKPSIKMGKPKRRVTGLESIRSFMSAKEAKELTPADVKYFRDLHKLCDEVFEEAAIVHGWSWSQLAAQAGLSYFTVVNLGERVTKFPKFRTVYKMVQAVGWNLVSDRNWTSGRVAKAG